MTNLLLRILEACKVKSKCPECFGHGWESSMELVGVPGADPMYGCDNCKDGTVPFYTVNEVAGALYEALTKPCNYATVNETKCPHAVQDGFGGLISCYEAPLWTDCNTTGRILRDHRADEPGENWAMCGRLIPIYKMLSEIGFVSHLDRTNLGVAIWDGDFEMATDACVSLLNRLRKET